jgi:hypothetical protein
MYTNTKPARRGGPARQGGFTCRGRKNSLRVDGVLMARQTKF